MTSRWLPPLAPIATPTGTRLSIPKQLDMLRWQLPMPFTLRDLSREIARQTDPRHEHRAGSLAEATLSDWLRRGAIRSTTAVGGLPAYGVAR